MIKSEIITELHKRTRRDINDCSTIVNTLEEIIWDALVDEGKIKWNGLLTMEVVHQPERMGRNPQTGEVETFTAKPKLICKLSKKLKKDMADIWG